MSKNMNLPVSLPSFVLKGGRILHSENSRPCPATVFIRNGKIEKIAAHDTDVEGLEVVDAGSAIVLPGIVDSHVHINEPGRTEWEGFQTATRAAAAGGITTVVDMPLNSIPPTTTLLALEKKRQSAKAGCSVDYGFWGGVIPGNACELQGMIDAGIRGFKSFLIDSGVEEFPRVTEADLRIAMPILAKNGVPLLVHAELDCGANASKGSDQAYKTYLESRPRKWEIEAVQMMIRLCRETKCAVHIVHLSAADALPEIGAAKKEGLPITVETCPHYLTLASEEIPEGATHYKCAPPIRENENRERLWTGLLNSEIDLIVSDHSPCSPALKVSETGDFNKAWGGISGLQFSLSVIWTEMRKRKIEIANLSKWMSLAPARLIRMQGTKGQIKPGADADIIILNPDASFTLKPAMIHHRHTLTPYADRLLYGKIEKTFLRGQLIYENDKFIATPVGQEIVNK